MRPLDDRAARIFGALIDGLGRGQQIYLDGRSSLISVKLAVHPQEIGYFRLVTFVRLGQTLIPVCTVFLAAGKPATAMRMSVAFYPLAETEGESTAFPDIAALERHASASRDEERAAVCGELLRAIDEELGVVRRRRRS